MKRISFALTPNQILDQTKTVTRRFKWEGLKPGGRLQPILKGMGLKKGEKQQLLGGPIEVVSVRREPIEAISSSDVEKEGFPDWGPSDFVDFLCSHYKCSRYDIVTRIEFKCIDR